MSIGGLAFYLGFGLFYAVALSLLTWLLLRAWRGSAARRDALALLPVFFFLMLTQHPFPDPATLDCAEGGTAPILIPFDSLGYFVRLIQRGASVADWASHRIVQATITNFAFCALAGIGLARFLTSWRQALIAGFALSLLAEVAQLKGLFGVYPCAYRTFEVDDLILNTAGTLAGYAIAARYLSGWRASARPRPSS